MNTAPTTRSKSPSTHFPADVMSLPPPAPGAPRMPDSDLTARTDRSQGRYAVHLLRSVRNLSLLSLDLLEDRRVLGQVLDEHDLGLADQHGVVRGVDLPVDRQQGPHGLGVLALPRLAQEEGVLQLEEVVAHGLDLAEVHLVVAEDHRLVAGL